MNIPTPVPRGRAEGKAPLEKFFVPLEQCIGYSSKLLDIIKKNLTPLRKLFSPLVS